MNRLFTKTTIAEAVMLAIAVYSIIPAVTAAELDLPVTPLITSTTIQPNMMLFLDSSGSMEYIVEDSVDYDKDTYSYSCSSTRTLNADHKIDIRVKNDGRSYFKRNGTEYDFGNSSGNGITGKTKKCFDDDLQYYAQLYAASGGDNNTKTTSSYPGALYDGKFLNWYFEGDNFSSGSRKRDNTQTRIEAARAATISLLDSLEDINVGLSQFDSGNGAKIIANIGDISTEKTNLKNKVPDIDAGSGGTPLAEALQEIGRYFTLGYPSSSDLTIHPDESYKSDVATSSVFSQSPAYASGISAPSSVTTQWCQQNFLVALTDGQPTNDQSNFSTYLQDYDGDCPGNTCNSYDKKTSGGYSYQSSGSDYADDVILAMYDIDLRPDLSDGSDEVKNNVTTYIVGFAEDALVNDPLMADMASAGGGSLLSAATSDELVAAFKEATDSIFAKVAAGSGVAFNTSQLSTESSIYAASFNSANWSGNLQSFDLSDTGVINATADWDAATQLDNLSDYTSRNIFSYNSTTKKGIAFNKSSISSAQLLDLQKGPEGSSDTNVENLIKYIKGDRSNEGSGSTDYRERESRLGDIVNSTVVHVGAPELNWPDYESTDTVPFGGSGTGDSYSEFKQTTRTEMLYVGANDGMLHGFGAADGEEKFAYIPSIVFSDSDDEGLHYLAESDYEHQFYVDLTPTVSDVFFSSEWHSILVGGLRSGGKGLFALDITDPSKFDDSVTANAESLALWEFSSADDDDFGYSYSKPTIAKMANGEWAVIVGNGYNNTGDGNAKLFIIFIDKNGSDTWTADSNYFEIDTGVGADGAGIANGLSTPRAIDLDGDSVVDRIYAGDLQGNMWAFDVDNKLTNKWDVAHQKSNKPIPLFTAKDSSDNAQPITTAPIASENTNPESGDPDIIIFFGTGKYIEETDKNSTDLMSYYGVLDNGTGEQTRSNLMPRELYSTSTTRVISGEAMTWSSHRGWYFDFEDQANSSATPTNIGERVISNSLITNDVLLFNTVIPTVANSDPCVANSESWIMAVDINTGKAPLYTVFDINKDGIYDDTTDSYDVDGDGDVDGDDGGISFGGTKIDAAMIAGDIAILADTIYSNDVDGNLTETSVNIEGTDKQGRLSWEEQVPQ